MNRTIYISLAVVATAATLAYALWGIDMQRLTQVLRGGHYWVVGPYLLLLSISMWFNAMRWSVILRPLGAFRWSALSPVMIIGFAGNNVLPARLGDLVRAIAFARRFRQPIGGSLVGIGLERWLDVMTVLVFYALGVLLLDSTPDTIRAAATVMTCLAVAMCMAIVLLVWYPRIVTVLWERVARWLPHSLSSRGSSLLEHALQALHSIRSPASVALLLVYSVLRWSCYVAMGWLTLLAFGAVVSPGLVCLLFAVSSMAAALPSTPGFIGPIQAAFVFTLVPYGVAQETAVAASALYLVAAWAPITLAGALFLLTSDLRPADLREQVSELQ